MMKFDAVSFIKELVGIPSISAQSAHSGDVERCARVLSDKFRELGFDSRIEKTPLHPIVFAQRNCAKKPLFRILCYGHYDVQPVDPLNKWKSDPFSPQVLDGRIYGRGTADNKGPFTCLLAGIADFLEAHPDAPIDFGIMVEGEEEVGSPSMSEFIKSHPDLISSYDFIVLSDTSSPSENQIVVTTGLRGTVSFDAVFKGPKTDVHSGMFGGMVYNPIQAMAEVMASLHSCDGFVNVPHFYDGISEIQDWEREQIKRSPFTAEAVRDLLGLKGLYRQGNVDPIIAGKVLPTLEFTGVGGGYQGEGSKSVIASECFFKVCIRTVPPQQTAKILELVKQAVRERTPEQVDVEFIEYDSAGDGYFVNPREFGSDARSRKLEKAFAALEECVESSFGCKPLFLREGASIPLIADIKKYTGLDSIMLGLFGPADNIHAPNESFSISLIEKARNYYKKFFERLCKC